MHLILFVVAITAALIHWIAKELVFVLTPSIEPSILIKAGGKPSKGEYVSFKFQHDLISTKPFLLTKKIACIQGDFLQVKEEVHFYCNDQYLGFAKRSTLDGKPMPIFKWPQGLIPKGKIFVTGKHVDSFDSKYWGFLDVSEVQRLKVIF